MVVYLEDEDSTTRKDAAICCCRLVANSLSSQYTTRSSRIGSRKRRHLVEEVSLSFLLSGDCFLLISSFDKIILHANNKVPLFL